MSDRIREWLDESQQLADKATAGPWTWGAAAHGDPTGGPTHHAVKASCGVVAETEYDIDAGLDAKFIAESRTRLPQAVAALRAVMETHRPVRDYGGTVCATCEEPYPCLTIEEVEAALEGDKR